MSTLSKASGWENGAVSKDARTLVFVQTGRPKREIVGPQRAVELRGGWIHGAESHD